MLADAPFSPTPFASVNRARPPSIMKKPPRPPRRRPVHDSALNAQQLRFVEEYLCTANATSAAKAAGYSAATARVAGPRLLLRPHVARKIASIQKARAERVGITQDRVLAELEELAFSNIDHYRVDLDGNVELTLEAPPRALRALQSIKRRIQETGWNKEGEKLRTIEVEIKLWDKPSMLKLAGQHVGILREQPKGGDDRVPVGKLSDETLAMLEADLAGRNL
jgi:phage terminase small subunit